MGSKTKTKNKPKPKPENSTSVAAVPPPHKPNNHAGKLISDPRFSSVHTDPRFRDAPKRKSKIQIDSRFSRMFTDKNFASSKTRIDKRGKSKGESENKLKRYYSLDEEEEEEEKTKLKNKNRKLKEEIIEDKIDDVSEDAEEEESDGESEEIEDDEEVKKVLNTKNKSGSLEDDEDEEDEDDEEDEEEEEEGESEEGSSSTSSSDEEEYVEEDDTFVQEENIPEIDKETNRLAIVNMDWSQVKAVDLYVLLSSFLPKGGQIKSVAVYPSEFGLQRMEEEAVRGPIGLFDDDSSDKEEDDDDDDNEEINEKKLREYELSRMRYYYAVVECDTVATADYLYCTCDGVEFERSAVKLDLRFIPDSLELKREPRDVATEPPSSYDGLDFETRVLQQTKVETTWDEDEPQRKKALRRKFNDDQLAELEFNEFLASSGTDDGSDKDIADKSTKNKKKDMYRALLQSGDGSGESEDEEGQDMEVTFNTGLEDISKRILGKKDKQSETLWEAYLRKKKEKKKGRKANAKSSDDDESDSDQEAAEQPDDFFIEEPSKKVKGALKSVKKKSETAEAEASKAELELLLADDNGADSNPKGYNLKPKKSKGKKGKEVPDESKIPTVDYEDPRFSQLFKSPLFALDPTDPQFKRSAAYARQLVQNQKSGGDTPDDNGDKQAENPSGTLASGKSVCKDEIMQSDSLHPSNQKRELSLMVSSLKMKAKQQRASNDVSRLLPAPKKRKKNNE